MGWPVVTVTSGGIPVTDNSTLGFGIPVEEAANGFGTAVTYVDSGGLSVLGTVKASPPPTPGSNFIDDNSVTSFVDDNGITSFTDDLGH